MAYITTALGMQLADPLTVQAFETTVVNSDFLTLENGILADRVRLSALEHSIRTVADLDALVAVASPGITDLRVVTEGGAIFEYNGTTWVQRTTANFATTAARDTAYAKAAGAFKVAQSAVVLIAGAGFETVWSPLLNGWRGFGAGLVPIFPDPAKITTTGLVINPSGSMSFAAASQFMVDTFMNADFDSYLLKVRLSSFTASTQLRMELRAAGATISSNTYDYTLSFANTATPASSVSTSQTLSVLNAVAALTKAKLALEISAGAVASEVTTIDGDVTTFEASANAPLLGKMFATERAFAVRDGIRLSPLAGTMTGKAWLYGVAAA